MLIVPRVTMKSGSFSLAINTPLKRPQTNPTRSPAPTPSQRFWGNRLAAIMLLTPTTDPTERSMPLVITTSVMPTAITALIEDCSMMWSRLAGR
jgi:hypothetical protein